MRQCVDDRQRRQRRHDVGQEEQTRGTDADTGEVAKAELRAEALATSRRRHARGEQ